MLYLSRQTKSAEIWWPINTCSPWQYECYERKTTPHAASKPWVFKLKGPLCKVCEWTFKAESLEGRSWLIYSTGFSPVDQRRTGIYWCANPRKYKRPCNFPQTAFPSSRQTFTRCVCFESALSTFGLNPKEKSIQETDDIREIQLGRSAFIDVNPHRLGGASNLGSGFSSSPH